MTNPFQKAERRKAKLRLALAGPSGSGKTYGALLLAKGLGGKTALVDTERGSASLYSHIMEFDVLEFSPPFNPEKFIAGIAAAEVAGYRNLIIDSISSEWNASGGILEIVDNLVRSGKNGGNSYAAWNEATPRHRAFVDAILQSGMNVIATMRSKTAYVLEEGKNGKTAPRKVGMAPEQRDGMEYEFTTVLDLSVDKNFANASKDRTGLFLDPFVISEATGKRLLAWLDGGAEVAAMTESVRADWIAAIGECVDLEMLNAVRDRAYDAAKQLGDKAAALKFQAAVLARKAAFRPAAEPTAPADGVAA